MSDESGGLIPFSGDEWGKAAKALIEKVSEGIGAAARPWQIRRVAKAEADAAIIAAESHVHITELQQRAVQRFVTEETRKQENIESITYQAAEMLGEEADPSKVDNDWIANFFDKSKIVSDLEAQALWVKLLAGEATEPGSFSKRSVNILADMSKSDALLFNKLCSYSTNSFDRVPLIFDVQNDIYGKQGLNFSVLNDLQSLGLITFSGISGYSTTGLPTDFMIEYLGRHIRITLNAGNSLDTGQVIFTAAGRQLAALTNPSPIEGFYEFLLVQLPRQAGVMAKPVNDLFLSIKPMPWTFTPTA